MGMLCGYWEYCCMVNCYALIANMDDAVVNMHVVNENISAIVINLVLLFWLSFWKFRYLDCHFTYSK